MKESIRKKEFVDPRFAKGKMYSKVISEIKEVKVCPFCPLHFKWHTKPILKQEKSWFITENFNPYKNTKHHFLIISKTHREQFEEIKTTDWKQITALASWVIDKYKLPGGGLAMRFGNTKYTGATVVHLHLHLIVPKVDNKKTHTVYFPFG